MSIMRYASGLQGVANANASKQPGNRQRGGHTVSRCRTAGVALLPKYQNNKRHLWGPNANSNLA
jgi:hypothetical protein